MNNKQQVKPKPGPGFKGFTVGRWLAWFLNY